MIRSTLTLLLGAVLVAGTGAVAWAQNGPMDQSANSGAVVHQEGSTTVVQPSPGQTVIIRPSAPSAGQTAVVQPPAQSPSETTIVEPAAPAAGGSVARGEEAVQNSRFAMSKIPANAVDTLQGDFPGGTIVDQSHQPLMPYRKVYVVDSQGRVHSAHVGKDGQVSDVKEQTDMTNHVNSLPENVRSAITQRWPNAVIYDSQFAFVNGLAKGTKVYFVSDGTRYEVKVSDSNGQIVKTENEDQETGHSYWPD